MNKKPLSDSRESVGGYTKYIRNGGSASLCGFVRIRASQVEQGGFVMLKGLICNHCAGAKQGLKGAHARKRKLPVGVHTHFNHVLHVGSFFFIIYYYFMQTIFWISARVESQYGSSVQEHRELPSLGNNVSLIARLRMMGCIKEN